MSQKETSSRRWSICHAMPLALESSPGVVGGFCRKWAARENALGEGCAMMKNFELVRGKFEMMRAVKELIFL